MKFEKLPHKEKRYRVAIGVICVIIIIGITTFTLTRAKYKYTNSIPLIKANVSFSNNDLSIVAIKLKDEDTYTDTDTVPTSGYIINTTESICKDKAGNKIDTTFEYKDGKVIIGVTKKGTKCTLVFDKHDPNAADFLIAKGEMVEENGYRYEGTTPNNYVSFNGEKWRIIGVFDVYSYKGGMNQDTIEQEKLVKLIRIESIGSVAWNSSDSSQWGASSLKELLNSGDYYSRSNGYSSTGLYATAKNMIKEVIWDLDGTDPYSMTADNMYIAERNKIYNDASYYGEVGLMYASDYAYASSDNDCSRTTLLNEYSDSLSCVDNWLMLGTDEWTITKSNGNSYGESVVTLGSYNGFNSTSILNRSGSFATLEARPVVYLKSSVKILDNGNDGSSSKPYNLSLS